MLIKVPVPMVEVSPQDYRPCRVLGTEVKQDLSDSLSLPFNWRAFTVDGCQISLEPRVESVRPRRWGKQVDVQEECGGVVRVKLQQGGGVTTAS
jgi:hypothetical protein